VFDSSKSDVAVDIEAIELETGDVQLIKDVTMPSGTRYIKLESVGLVTALDGTGSDPPPSRQRQALTGDMQARQAKDPNRILSSPDTSLVLVRTYLPPGVTKGDPCDVEVRVPRRSDTTSLRGGWLMETRLREVAMLNSSLRTGRVDGLAGGQVVTDAVFDGDGDEVSHLRGRVLGGGVALTSRSLGLVVRSENNSVKTSSLVSAAINDRFHTYDRGAKKGVATPKRDNYVDLAVHSRYKHNLARYMRVVQNIAVTESPRDRIRRMELLEQKLLDPATSSAAALQLEAIGKEAIPYVRRCLRSQDPEVRFYAAEALAYMDDAEAAEPLTEAARNEPAFRWHAIAALSAMDHINAHEGLAELLNVSSAETRYAAFRALWMRNPVDPLVRGEKIGDEFAYHKVRSTGPAMIHFARSRRCEIVAFGDEMEFRPPPFLFAGKNLMLKEAGPGRIKVIRFAASKEDKQAYCSTQLDDVIRTIVKLGGGYADVLQCLQDAKGRSYVDARVVVDALPRPGRAYHRQESGTDDMPGDEPPMHRVSSPLPEMFTSRLPSKDGEEDSETDDGAAGIDSTSDDEKNDSFLGKLGDLLTNE